jgi:hypothetical protein
MATIQATGPLRGALTPRPRLRRGLRPYIYHIESRTRPGVMYLADVSRLTCTCLLGRQGRPCPRLELAVQYHAWRRDQSAQQPATEPAE